jgi:hypothetical protein
MKGIKKHSLPIYQWINQNRQMALFIQQTNRLLSLLTYSRDQNQDNRDSDQPEDLADHFSARALFVS